MASILDDLSVSLTQHSLVSRAPQEAPNDPIWKVVKTQALVVHKYYCTDVNILPTCAANRARWKREWFHRVAEELSLNLLLGSKGEISSYSLVIISIDPFSYRSFDSLSCVTNMNSQ